jgi:hypothetical protein
MYRIEHQEDQSLRARVELDVDRSKRVAQQEQPQSTLTLPTRSRWQGQPGRVLVGEVPLQQSQPGTVRSTQTSSLGERILHASQERGSVVQVPVPVPTVALVGDRLQNHRPEGVRHADGGDDARGELQSGVQGST